MLETPDRLFTVATPETDRTQSGHDPAEFLFVSRSNDPEIQDSATQFLIMNDPFFQELIKGGAIIHQSQWYGQEQEGFCWRVCTDIGGEVLQQLEAAKEDSKILVYEPNKGVETIDLRDVYYGCTLPHKSILGCTRCFQGEDNPKDCRVKKLYQESTGIDAEDAIEKLQNRISQIGGFTYISPRLTLADDFGKTYRYAHEHDFSAIDYNSEQIQKGLKERSRFHRFEKNACSQCFIREVCEKQRSRISRRHCPGPYPATEGDAIVEILGKVRIPFSDEELAYFLENSYELDKRYNRCKYWTTFTVERDELKFGIKRHTQPYNSVETFRTVAEAENFIEKYGRNTQIDHWKFPVNPLLKAVLIELAARSTSPTNCAGWRTVAYGKLAVVLDYQDRLECKFALNGGRGTAWFSATASSLAEVYQNWEKFRFIGQTYHDDRHKYEY